MPSRLRRQLVLQLGHEPHLPPAAENSLELVQVLAELLLEALGEGDHEEANAGGGRDESEDHV